MQAKGLLDQRDAAVEQFGRAEVIERRVRIGVTELTAMTWLPRWVELHYPQVTLEPDVDSSVKSSLLTPVVMLAQECCDFSRMFQGD